MSVLSDAALDRFLAEDPGGAVVMLNLLRFRPDGGRERYMEYAAAVQAQGLPAELHDLGQGEPALAGDEWDAVALVRYENRQAFADMVRSPEYRAIEHLRTSALVDAVLQPTMPV
jgi:hypothetical protein